MNIEESSDINNLTNQKFSSEASFNNKIEDSDGSKDVLKIPNDATTELSLDFYRSCGINTCCCVSDFFSSQWWIDYILGFKFVRPTYFVSSQFMTFPFILGFRILISLYITATLIGSLVDSFQNGYWFAYFTHLSFFGLNLYYWAACYLSIKHATFPEESLNRNPRAMEYLASWLYTFAFTSHIVVPLIYWTLLGTNWNWDENTPLDRWLNITQHGFDFFAIFFESFMNKIVFCWGHLLLFITLMILYIFWSWIFAALYPSFGFPYFFVNYNRPSTILWIIGISIGFIIIWCLAAGYHSFKDFLGEKIEKRQAIRNETIPMEIIVTQ